MAQITSITSEALQATIRRLLPSQQGFGEDLQATNVITPIIDLTPSAEGSEVRADLQTALAFGSQTAHSVNSTTSTLINTTGFFRVYGVASLNEGDTSATAVSFSMSDGSSTKKVWELTTVGAVANNAIENALVDFTIFLRAGDSLTCTATALGIFVGSSRQIADVNGVLVNPSGFTPQ